MVQLLIQVDDQLAKELNKAVPAKSRRRSEFIRRAIRTALMALEDDALQTISAVAPNRKTI